MSKQQSAPKITCDDVVAATNEAHKSLDKLIESGADQAFIDNARKILRRCTSETLAGITKAQAENLRSLCTNDRHEAQKEQQAQKSPCMHS